MRTTIGQLTARDHRVWRLAYVAGLFEPANDALLRHLPDVRRVLAVAPNVGLRGTLERYLDAQCRSGLLDGYHVVGPPEETMSPLDAVGWLGTTAVAAGLARRDAFLVCGHGLWVNEALVAAAMFRRHTRAVWVATDRASLVDVECSGGRVRIPGGIAVQHRQLTVLVDQDAPPGVSVGDREDVENVEPSGVLAVAAQPGRVATCPPVALRSGHRPAKTVDRVTQPTLRYQVEAVHGAFGPGSRWRVPVNRSTDRLAAWLQGASRVLAVVDAYSAQIVDTVRRYLRRAREHGDIAEFTVREIISTPSVKTLSSVEEIVTAANEMGLRASDRMVAVGGGTVLDLVGAAALLYQEDTPYLRVPTTLVGMIDAGIGLKVGIDVDTRRNLLGGYHPPLACLCDGDFLATLPEAEIRCGLAEAVKIAMVTDRGLFELIERHWQDVLERKRSAPVRRVIRRSIRAMLGQLAMNPFERDLRRLPDFGHEYAHVLESASGYRLRHGEAVSVGMALAGELGVLTGRLSRMDQDRMVRLLTNVGLATFDELCDPERLWRWLRTDVSAHKGGSPHLVVPTAVGSGNFIHSIDELSEDALRRACARLSGGSQTTRTAQ